MWPTCDQPWSHGWMEGAGGHSTPRLRPHRNVETSLNHTESCWWFEVGPIDGTMGEALFFFCVLQKTLFPTFGEKNHMDFLLCFQWSMNDSKVWSKTYEKTALMYWYPRRLFPAVYRICHLLPWRERPPTKSVSPLKPNNDDFQGTCFSPCFFFHP